MSTRSRRRFTPEFKAEAVEMVEAAGGNIARVAKELGIYDSTLGNSTEPGAVQGILARVVMAPRAATAAA